MASPLPRKSGTKFWPCDAGAAGSLTGCGSSGQGDGKNTIIRVAFNQPETHAEYIALADFGEKFAAATNGRYQVEIYPNAVLGD